MKRLAKWLMAVALIGFGVFWWLSSPIHIGFTERGLPLSVSENAIANGERIFWASGCASCHAKKGAEGDEKLLLGGGYRLETPFGTFVTPNISPDPVSGIGNWTPYQFMNAMVAGVSREGSHYYPSFPYSSYNKLEAPDILDLLTYIKSLPSVTRENEAHELGLLYSWRRPIGIWKRLYTSKGWAIEVDETNKKLERGRYLVEALGHCAECHTPRNFLGGLKTEQWLAGGPAPEGEGKIPNITPDSSGIGSWSEGDIVYYLESGFTPDFDSVGGTMTSVQQNMAKLPKEDLEAIAAYLKAVPAISSQ